MTVAHGIADGFGQGVGEKEEVSILVLDAPKIGNVFARDDGWVWRAEAPVAMDTGQCEQGGEDLVVVGVTVAAWFPGGTGQADGQAMTCESEQMLERLQ